MNRRWRAVFVLIGCPIFTGGARWLRFAGPLQGGLVPFCGTDLLFYLPTTLHDAIAYKCITRFYRVPSHRVCRDIKESKHITVFKSDPEVVSRALHFFYFTNFLCANPVHGLTKGELRNFATPCSYKWVRAWLVGFFSSATSKDC